MHKSASNRPDNGLGRGLHRIEDELAETWLEDWADAGIAEIEDSLAKHAAFLTFLEAKEAQ